MREIKFRAWHKEQRKFFDVSVLQFPTSFNPGYAGTLKVDGVDTLFPYDAAVAVMEYTGLKDKDGQEIYEGDIVEVEDRGKRLLGTVEWHEPGFSCLTPVPKGDVGFRLDLFSIECGEVIGNIYESSELLEVKSQ